MSDANGARLVSIKGRDITIDIDGTTYVRQAADHVTPDTLDAHVEALIVGLLIEHAAAKPLPSLGA
ncbi:MAG: hypothetical protein A2Y38_22495 [Spirochaetes bacterium GWB1_59_5]|nr:MAG: hypothetical protein A2Y38_22495 [Spirochaetes bacterium GWB1_59_5]